MAPVSTVVRGIGPTKTPEEAEAPQVALAKKATCVLGTRAAKRRRPSTEAAAYDSPISIKDSGRRIVPQVGRSDLRREAARRRRAGRNRLAPTRLAHRGVVGAPTADAVRQAVIAPNVQASANASSAHALASIARVLIHGATRPLAPLSARGLASMSREVVGGLLARRQLLFRR